MKHFALTIFLLIMAPAGVAQNTLSYEPGMESPLASIADVSWISGHWKGEGFGGEITEFCSDPSAGSIMCGFKMVQNNQVQLYEFITITEEGNTLIKKLKHFTNSLQGWEDKDEWVSFKLIKVTENRVYFDGLTYEKVNDQHLRIYLSLPDGTSRKEHVLNYYKE